MYKWILVGLLMTVGIWLVIANWRRASYRATDDDGMFRSFAYSGQAVLSIVKICGGMIILICAALVAMLTAPF